MENNSNKLGKMPVLKLMAVMSIPAMFSMLVQALYNIVDSVFVGMISDTDTEMLSLNIAFPLQMIFFAIALGIGIGTNSLISRKLGEGNHSEASKAALTGLFLGGCAILVAIASSFFLPKLFLMIYDQPENVENMSIQYLSITMGFSFGMFAETIFNKILQSTGNMKIPMFSQLIGAITNIILDPIFIFKSGATYSAPFIGEFVMPFGFGLEVRGAAIATVIGQIVAGIFVVCFALFKKQAVSFSLKNFKLSFTMIKQIFNVGIAVTIVNSINSISTIILNFIFQFASVEIGGENVNVGATVLGTYFKLQSFIFMPVFGMNQGVMPILGYNYGAKNASRFNKTFIYAMSFGLIIMTLGLILFQAAPAILLQILSITPEVSKYGVVALRIVSISFLAAAGNIICSSLFQAIGHGIKSAALNLLRQAFILIPLATLITLLTHNINFVWIAFPVAEWLCLAIFTPIIVMTIIKVNKQMNTNIISENTR